MKSSRAAYLTLSIFLCFLLCGCQTHVAPSPLVPDPMIYKASNTGNPVNMNDLARGIRGFYKDGKHQYYADLDFSNIYFKQFPRLHKLLGSSANKVSQLNLSGNFSSSIENTFPEAYSTYANFMQVLYAKDNRITRLDLDSNGIDSQGAIVLASLLQHNNNNIARLNLRDNLIGNAGVYALAEAILSPNCKLNEIDLSANTFNSDARAVMKSAVSKVTSRKIKVKY
jgi:hypothetical protein